MNIASTWLAVDAIHFVPSVASATENHTMSTEGPRRKHPLHVPQAVSPPVLFQQHTEATIVNGQKPCTCPHLP